MSAVVIGAGPNGLAAAIRLAEAGQPVTVLEAADHPGGAVRTEELTLPGLSPRHVLVGLSRRPRRRRCSRGCRSSATACAGRIRSACYAHPLPGGRAVALYRDLDRDRGEPRRHAPRRRRQLAGVRRADARRVRGGPRDDARRLPADRAARCACSALSGRSARHGSRAAAGLGRGARAPAVRRRRIAGVAVRLGRARRRPADGRRQRGRGRVPEPDGPRRRLAQPDRRRRAADRRARRLPPRAGRRGAHRCAGRVDRGRARPRRRRPRSRAASASPPISSSPT